MRIQLADLPEGHTPLTREEPADALELREWLEPKGLLRVELDVERRGEQIALRGRCRVEGDQACSRCAKVYPAGMEAEILLVADRRGSDDPEDEAALEQDGSVLYHDGIELDLGPSLREALILEVPVAPLCRPDCRGLCSRCGQDLNDGSCQCTPAGSDPRWDALRELNQHDS